MICQIKVRFECEPCEFPLSWDETTVTNQTIIYCPKCKEPQGAYGDIVTQAEADVSAKISSIFEGRSSL